MNILFLCDEYPPGKHGGIGTSVQTLARELVAQGHSVVVAGFYDQLYGGQDFFSDNGVLVYRFRRSLKIPFKRFVPGYKIINKLFSFSGIWDIDIQRSLKKYHSFLESLIRKYKIDIIERPDFNDYARFCHKKRVLAGLSVPVVVKLHGSMTYFSLEAGKSVNPCVKDIELAYFKQAAAISSVSNYTAVKTKQYFNFSQDIEILYNGIVLRENDSSNRQEGKVIFTGSLIEKKGIFQLMKAWNIVIKVKPTAQLIVLGKGNVQAATSLLEKNALHTVQFKGHVNRSELFKHLEQAEIAVFPSYAECFALAPMEAMESLAAVIYTQRASGPELITSGKDGVLIDPDNIKEIASAIIYLLDNKSERERIALNGRLRVEQAFAIRKIAEENIRFYTKTIENSKND